MTSKVSPHRSRRLCAEGLEPRVLLDAAAFPASLAHVVGHEVVHLLGFAHGKTADDKLFTMSAVAYFVGYPWGAPTHQYIGNEAYRYFTDQFGTTELTQYLATVQTYYFRGDRFFLEGSYDADIDEQDPWNGPAKRSERLAPLASRSRRSRRPAPASRSRASGRATWQPSGWESPCRCRQASAARRLGWLFGG